ncbi:MAG TPA: insulinase family protein, partial [Polyangiaceae bacterium]|nr:insulinase family protein [Polyangiaceae bacterium]
MLGTCGRSVLVVASSLLLAFSACGPMRSARAPGVEALSFAVKQERLANGLRLVQHDDASQGLISLVLVVGAGSGRDPAGKEGLAHLVEHLVFRGQDANGVTLRDRLRDLGAEYNGWTSSDETAYVATATKASASGLLAAFHDLLLAPLQGVDEATFQVERNVVENERRLRSENGYPSEVFAKLDRALYGDSFYGKPTGGTGRSLETLTLEDARDFARTHYRPQSMTLLVAGTSAVTSTELAASFGGVHPEGDHSALSKPQLPPALVSGPGPIERAQALVGVPELWLAWRLPGAFGKERAALDVIEDLAASSLAEVTTVRSDVAEVAAFLERGPNVSTLYCRAVLSRSDDLEGVRKALAHELDKGIASRALDADWRFLYTREEATRRMLGFEPLGARAVGMALGAHYARDPSFVVQQAAAIDGLGAEDLNGIANRFLNLEQSRTVLLEPGAAGPVASLSGATTSDGHSGSTDSREAVTAAQLAVPQLQEKTLQNGLKVVAVERGGDRFFTAWLGFLDGAARKPLAVARAADWSVVNYISKPPAGIGFGRFAESDAVVWFARSHVAALDLGLETMVDRFTHHEIRWKSQEFVEWLKVADKIETPTEIIDRNLSRVLLGESALSAPLPREIDAVRVQDIRSWRDTVLRPENGTLVVVGPDQEAALSAAETHLGSWRRSAARKAVVAPAELPPSRAHGLRLSLVPRKDLSQTALKFGCRLPKHDIERAAAEDVLVRGLEGVLEWRLRERAGASYYVSAGVERLRGGLSVLWLATAVGDPHLTPAVEALLGWLQ